MSEEPIILRHDGWSSIFAGAICIAVAGVGTSLSFRIIEPETSDVPFYFWLDLLFFSILPLYLATTFVGRGIRKPVMLRIDLDGVSGYNVPPARWSDIANVAPYTFDDKAFIGFSFKERDQVLSKMSVWKRVLRNQGIFGTGFDLLVSVDRDRQNEVIASANAFRAAADNHRVI